MTTNYKNGKIYKIEPINGEEGDIYIGSTTKEYLSQRMTSHRGDYGKWKNGKRDKIRSFCLFEKYGIENCKIILLENCPCDSKDELLSKESFYIRSLKCINKIVPDRTVQEYRKDNKERIAYIKKQYRENNIEKIKDQEKLRKSVIYYCECGSIIKTGDKAKHLKTLKHQNFLASK